MVRMCLVLKENINWLSRSRHGFAFPPTVKESSRYSTSSPAPGVLSVLGVGHSNKCGVVAPCFNLQFTSDVKVFFTCLFATYMSYLVRCQFRSLAYFLIDLFSYCRVLRILGIFWVPVLYWRHFLPFTCRVISPIATNPPILAVFPCSDPNGKSLMFLDSSGNPFWADTGCKGWGTLKVTGHLV